MIRIGCVQYSPVFGEIPVNLEKFTQFVAEANADILIFPELALTGYFFTSKAQALQFAESIHGPLITKIKLIAQKHNITVVTGFLEKEGNILYNSAIAIDCHGNLVGHYRKVHLFYYEKIVFATGNLGFPVFDTELRNGEKIKLGLEICYDWRFPEATRSLAIKGAEVIAIPSNIVTTTGMLLDTLKVRAFENKVIIAFADRIGAETSIIDNKPEEIVFRGESSIINYNGDLLTIASSYDESITYADVLTESTRLKNINKFNDIIKDRQNTAYFT